MWDKVGVVHFKSEFVAILQRKYGFQVEFIVAFEDLTREGYRSRTLDEGKTGYSGGFMGGINSYYYFQRNHYIKE